MREPAYHIFMKSPGLAAFVLAAAVAATALVSPMWLWAAPSEMRMFFALDSDREDDMRFALLYGLRSAQRLEGRTWELEILAGGKAVHMFLEGSPVLEYYEELRSKKANVRFRCCGESVTKMQKRLGADRVKLLPGAEVVASCDKRIQELKDEGWTRVVPPEE